MNIFLKPRKLSHPASEMTRLKLLWRNTLTEAERDYWRQQFSSARSHQKLRQELLEKHDVNLLHDNQLIRFRRWVELEDARKEEAEQVESDRAELEAQGLTGEELRNELLRRMKERALARGDYKLGVAVVRLDLNAERVSIQERRLELEVRRADTQEKILNESLQSGGLTPEVLHKIETEDLHLM